MSSPPNRYPNHERKYPNAEPEPAKTAFGRDLEAELGRLAPSKVTVLLVGGSSAAQGEVALALHQRSARAQHPFVGVDCAGLDSDAVELLLFGGPIYARSRQGAAQRAGEGTLYVARVDELPLLVQPRFLRFLDQERDARVVASADMSLLARVGQGHFRAIFVRTWRSV
jgi:two-component system, NtrC family, nitrogen regulation response regulator GlnG